METLNCAETQSGMYLGWKTEFVNSMTDTTHLRSFGFGFGRSKLLNIRFGFGFGRKLFAYFRPLFGFGRNLKITFGRSLCDSWRKIDNLINFGEVFCSRMNSVLLALETLVLALCFLALLTSLLVTMWPQNGIIIDLHLTYLRLCTNNKPVSNLNFLSFPSWVR